MKKTELLAIHNAKSHGMFVCLKPKIPFVITKSLVHDARNLQDFIAEKYIKDDVNKPFYLLWYLHSGKIPWKGIDFNFVYNALLEHKETEIQCYISELFDLLYLNTIGMGLQIVNCSIITRPLMGISRDFFYLNQISFIKKSDHSADASLNKIDYRHLKNEFYFPLNLYSENSFYGYNKFNITEMQKALNVIEPSLHSKECNLEIKRKFEEKKMDTLDQIETLAKKNMKILERLARIQAVEHQMFKA